jgi:acyl-CoA synthetase (AMP-forming)/AMP-acid ligase II/SAM-dependent methyltransferase
MAVRRMTRPSSPWVSAAGVTLADQVPAGLRRSWVGRGHCPDQDLYSLFSEHVRACPERVAVAWADGEVSYAELDRKARAAAAALADAGLTARDIIAIAMPSDWRAVVAELAVAAVGAVALPYPAGRGSRDARSLLGRSRASAMITAGTKAAELTALRPSLPWLREIFTFGPGGHGTRCLDDWLAAPPDWRPCPADPEAPARILVSSGSESEPTMVVYSHNAMAGGRGNYLAALHQDPVEPMRNLILVPLASSYGSCATSVTIARHGGTVLLPGPFDPAAAIAMMISHRPFLVFGVPTMLRRMADLPPEDEFPALRALISSAAPLPATTAAACAERFGVPVINVYGSSDGVNCHAVAAGPDTGAYPGHPGRPGHARRPGYAGNPDPAVAAIRVADADGNALPPGKEGEIQALGPMTPLCYVHAPELDARYRAPGGWVRTGDSGVLEADGALWVTGRMRQVIIRGGYNISAAEVEREIGAHPLVTDVACVAVTDADLGERVCACLAQRPGTPPLTVAGLAAFLETERGLDRVKLPEFLLHLPELPVGPTGKACRRTLAHLAAQGEHMSSAVSGQEVYVFNNASEHAVEQHRCLAEFLDPVTIAGLAATGVTAGWRCLEAGAGGGSVARWLAARVAPSGAVLATDINPVHVPWMPGLDIRQHDITRDPLPEDAYDLAHARLVLLHLPERLTALRQMVRSLRPGGQLVLEEFDARYCPALLAPDDEAAARYAKYTESKVAVMESAGADMSWGQRVGGAMRDAGLTQIEIKPLILPWRGGSPGARLQIHHTRHLREKFLRAGITDADLARFREVLSDPEFVACTVLYSVRGTRPAV